MKIRVCSWVNVDGSMDDLFDFCSCLGVNFMRVGVIFTLVGEKFMVWV